MIDQPMTETAAALRRTLHAVPDRPGCEARTARTVAAFLRAHTSLEIEEHENWLLAVHREPDGGAPVAFRAELDAVPTPDGGAAHRCGHDGHTAALCAFACALEGRTVGRTVYLLFQPAEETGEGALVCLPRLRELGLGAVYGWHNLPGRALGRVVWHEGVFACASRGLIVRLTGTPAHAAYPEQGRNPAPAVGALLTALDELARPARYRGMVLCTVVGVSVGARAFGVSAGEGEVALTIRAHYADDLAALQTAIEQKTRAEAEIYGLTAAFEIRDDFVETASDPVLLARLRAVCETHGFDSERADEPYRWSEDFGRYAAAAPCCFFGLGAGEEHAGLHTADYDFPDALIGRAAEVMLALVQEDVPCGH